jgi:hypothetical protein
MIRRARGYSTSRTHKKPIAWVLMPLAWPWSSFSSSSVFPTKIQPSSPRRRSCRNWMLLGSTFLVPGVVRLPLTLQWGGQTYAVSYLDHYFGFALHRQSPVEQWTYHSIVDSHGSLASCLRCRPDLASYDGNASSAHFQATEHSCWPLVNCLRRLFAVYIW